MNEQDKTQPTIYALASGRGRAGVAVVRISGPFAEATLKGLIKNKDLKPRTAEISEFKAPGTAEVIDKGLYLWFPGPNSFTGEDVAELHVHGSPAVLEKLFKTFQQMGLRPAEPGEFTRRAFENGKMDLTQAEGLHDLVFAETEAQRKQALYQMAGGLSEIYRTWRDQLIDCLADIEATIDFSDEEIPDGLMDRVKKGVQDLKSSLEKTLPELERGRAIRTGFKIVLLGPTNVGKSSLLNALAKEDKAIVSDIAGTTRDAIEVHLDLAGYSVVLVDTAGLRDAGDAIEEEGIRRSLSHAKEADLKLLLWPADSKKNLPQHLSNHLKDGGILVLTKSDLVKAENAERKEKCGFQAISISAKTGAGLKDLVAALETKVVEKLEASEPASLTRVRHQEAVLKARDALDRFLGHDLGATDPALLAEDLRLAARALASITGEVGVEEILGKIFSQFCIGK